MLVVGAVILIIGGLIVLFGNSLGGFPGTIKVEAQGFSCIVPILVSIILSIVLTVVVNIVIRMINKP